MIKKYWEIDICFDLCMHMQAYNPYFTIIAFIENLVNQTQPLM